MKNQKTSWSKRAGEVVDSLVGIVSARAALKRKACRFAYDAIDGSRLRKKRTLTQGTGDTVLTDSALWRLREICRDLYNNNPLVKGILKTDRDSVVGSGVKIEAKTGDPDWNDAAEAAFKEWAESCEVTGRLSFNQFLRLAYLSYRRDGDMGVILTEGKLQAVEGEQIGTPYGFDASQLKFLNVVNGIAYAKETGRVIGYYVGRPNDYGYIDSDSVKKYQAQDFHHIFNPERFTCSRGEPALTSSIDFIDKLCSYVDAELVAAKVNACFSVFIARKDPYSEVGAFPVYGGDSGDQPQQRREQLEPGTIMYGEPGESASGIGQTRPGSLFDPFVLRMLTLIGRPLCMPLMLITLDYAGATFMNARIAYQKAQENWIVEQDHILKPFVSRIYRWKISQFIKEGILTPRDDAWRHEVICNRWPYVDPSREAEADKLQMENRVMTLKDICSRNGLEWKDQIDQIAAEKEYIDAKLKDKSEKGEIEEDV